MHVADPSIGILGANAIVGASMPLATGAALSSKLLDQDRVAVAFFGEGAVNQGSFHEALNLAAIWDLPTIYFCENNLYAEFSDSRKMTRVPKVADRASAYGVRAETIDGNDVQAVHEATVAAVEDCRQGRGPVLLEAETYRWQGHYEGDGQPYKPQDEIAAWKVRDPLTVASERLIATGVADQRKLAELRELATRRVERAVESARLAPEPALEEAYSHVFGD
jgi:TPP-dependent pyruvate/acetoin dehydrogenase alpha subunit